MSWLNFFRGRCVCGERATAYPHGIPCCDEHYHDAECLSWLDEDDECDCDYQRLLKMAPHEELPDRPRQMVVGRRERIKVVLR